MKKIIILLASVLISISCPAQRPGEWLNQQNTQTKYLLQQIAAFQAYLGSVQKGYSVAHQGLTTIGYLKDGERQLHTDYFGSLQKVNPIIRNSPQVAAIISLQLKVVQTCQNTLQRVKRNGQLNPEESTYIQRVVANLLQDGAGNTEELLAVLTPNQWKMTDTERLQRIDALYEAMLEKLALAQQLANETKVLTIQRQKAQNALKTSQALYGF